MSHAKWCGEKCSECSGCSLDNSISCSPDCELLPADGEPQDNKCAEVGCEAYLRSTIYDRK